MKINERSLVSWASSPSPVDKDGILHKKGEVNKGFQKRWFVLKGNLLFYFDKRQDRDPVGVIVLEEHSVSLSQLREPKYCFEIGFQGHNARTYTLSAESEESMTSWMRALTHASFQYLRMMVDVLQRQVVVLTEQKKDTAPLGLDRVQQPVATSGRVASSVRSKVPPPRPPQGPQPKHEPLVQPLKTLGMSHEQRSATCGASAAEAIGCSSRSGRTDTDADGGGDLMTLATTPSTRSSHLAHSSPTFARQHLKPADDPTPALQPKQAHSSSTASSVSAGAEATAADVFDEVGAASAGADAGLEESTEQQLQRLSFHSMHYNSSFLRDSPLSQRRSGFHKSES